MALTFSILAAALFAVFGFPYKYYQSAYSWSRNKALGGIAVYLLVAGGGGGLLGWLLGVTAKASPTPFILANGAIFGVGGALAIRADFRTSSRTTRGTLRSTGSSKNGNPHLQDAASALGVSLVWINGMLDEVVTASVEKWLIGLSVEGLTSEAIRVGADLDNRADINPTFRSNTQKKILENIRKMALVDAVDNETGRQHLIMFCRSYIVEQRLRKTKQDSN